MRALELLAPARNLEIGIAAIDCGADAVYLAGPSFGARQAAGNSLEDVEALCDYAHRYGARVYVTLNTILYDRELDEAFRLARAIQEAGADALIVQDFSLLRYKELFPESFNLPLHASTQCSIRTPETAQRLRALGFSRLVLERELTMDGVRQICSETDAEIEAFVHGALCVCYSGQCYLSAHLNGRSANRGECIQACRSRYDLVDCSGEPLKDAGRSIALDKTLLSLRDLNMLDHLGEMADAGVMSFKIEGRLKGLSYVRNVVAAYSDALDRLVEASRGRYCRASFGFSRRSFTPDVNRSFNRGFTDLGRRDGWACLEAGKALGEYIGVVERLHRGGGNMEIIVKDCKAQLHNGDGLSFIGTDGRESGFKADVCEGRRVICSPMKGLKPGTRLWRNYDTAFEREVGRGASRLLRAGISIKSEIISEGCFRLELIAGSEDGRRFELVREIQSELARDRQRMQDIWKAQLSRTSGIFLFDLVSTEGDLPMLGAAGINALRRELAGGLDSMECHRRPILNLSPQNNSSLQSNSSPGGKTLFPEVADYRNDVANAMAADVYRRGGSRLVYPAYELSLKGIHPQWSDSGQENIELMRSRYCILRELGYCRKTPAYQRLARQNRLEGGIFIRNNGRSFRLGFDCVSCEMTLTRK